MGCPVLLKNHAGLGGVFGERVRGARPAVVHLVDRAEDRALGRELEADLGRSAPPPSAPERPSADDKSVVEIPSKKNKISFI